MSTANSVVLNAKFQFTSVRNLFSLFNFFVRFALFWLNKAQRKQKSLHLGEKHTQIRRTFSTFCIFFRANIVQCSSIYVSKKVSLAVLDSTTFSFHHVITKGIKNFVSTRASCKAARPVIPVTDQTSISSSFCVRTGSKLAYSILQLFTAAYSENCSTSCSGFNCCTSLCSTAITDSWNHSKVN